LLHAHNDKTAQEALDKQIELLNNAVEDDSKGWIKIIEKNVLVDKKLYLDYQVQYVKKRAQFLLVAFLELWEQGKNMNWNKPVSFKKCCNISIKTMRRAQEKLLKPGRGATAMQWYHNF
jgi:hypothetical protein